MTFLNPLYLIALAAAAIPIILHLLNLRKSRVIEFSTLTFLKELQRSQIRRLKIKRWILLALRTLIIIFVVFAFTRPALRSGFGFLPGTAAKSSVIIILDNSFSMMTTDRQGPLLTQAKRKANELIDLLENGDEAVLLLTTDTRDDTKEFTAAHNALRRELKDIEASYIHGDYAQTLAKAGVLMERSSNFNKEVYIITDRQRSQYMYDRAVQAPAVLDKAVRVFVLPLGSGESNNAAITDVELRSTLYEVGKAVDLRATVLNTSTTPLTDAMVSAFLDGQRVTTSSVTIGAGEKRSVDFSITPRKAGWVQGYVELEDDELPEDNRRYFSFNIPEQIRILIGPSTGRDAQFVSLALNPFADEAEASGVFHIQNVDRGRLPAENLERCDVLILTGAKDLPAHFIQRVASWVHQGGSVLLFPDADASTENFSNILLPALGILPPAGLIGTLGQQGSFTTFGAIDFDHPLFRGLFEPRPDGRNPEIDSPELNVVLRLRGSEHARAVIGTRGGDAFLLDADHGKGRVLVFGVSADTRWSDFAYKGLFVPLLNRSMYYLASRDDNTVDLLAGEVTELSIPSLPAGDALFELRSADGGVQRVVPKSLPSGLVFPIEAPVVPGVFTLAAGETVLRTVVVNADARESDLQRAEAAEENAFFSHFGIDNIRTLTQTQSVQQAVTEVRFGVELWKYMIALALLCAGAEMLLARDRKRASPEAQTAGEHSHRS